MSKIDRNIGLFESGEYPTVHVLMPVYNGARFLESQLDSILAQSYPNVHITVLNDGSSDASKEILNEYGNRFPNVEVLHRSVNQGLIPSLSELLSRVDDEFFALSDQDDVWDPDKIARSIEAICQQGVDLVYSDVRLCNSSGDITHPEYLRHRRIHPHVGRRPLPYIFRNPIIGHTIVGTGRLARAASPLPPTLTFHEAWIASVSCTLLGVGYIPSQLGSYRVHESNVIGPKGAVSARHYWSREQRRWLQQREETRRAGLEATSEAWPLHGKLARMYRLRGLSRMVRIPAFFRALWIERASLGERQVLVESVYFGLGALARRNDKQS